MAGDIESTFDSSVETVARMLQRTIESTRSDREERLLPSETSPAMRAWSAQPRFLTDKEGPVDVSRSLATACLRAGEDHVLAFCRLLTDPETQFIWSLTVLARASLEAFAIARHLTESGLSDRRRNGRAINELIHSIKDTEFARGKDETARAIDRRKSEAEAMGLSPHFNSKGKPTNFFEEARPSLLDLVERLVDGTESIRKKKTKGLGDSVYRHWSQIAHSTGHGLLSTLGEPIENPITGTLSAPLVISFEDVMVRSSILYLAHKEALMHYMSFNGWPQTEHSRIQPEAEKVFLAYFAAGPSQL
jgi:hypothetical protein